MYGSSHSRGGFRFAFPVIASLLILIATLGLLSSRKGGEDSDSTQALKTDKSSSRIADMIVMPLTLLNLPLRGSEHALLKIKNRSNLEVENEALKLRILELSDAEMRANALAIKIKRFEDLLAVDIGIDIPEKKIAARVVTESNGPFAHSALLNSGANHGTGVGHAVMAETGLFGHVVAVGKRSARVLMLQDINSRIAVMSPRSEARAIMIGTNARYPKLSFVASNADWQDGDTVVTSGDEGVLPRGLAVGVVRRRSPSLFDVKLLVDTESVDWVWVLPYSPIKAPEDDPVVIEDEAALVPATKTEAKNATDTVQVSSETQE